MRRSRHPLAIALLLCATCLIASPLMAQGKGKGHGKGKGEERAQEEQAERGGRASSDEVRIIRDYYSNTANLPPGLAKRGSLPPGLARQLRRNGTLPPGLAKRAAPLPDDLERRLPPLPDGRRRWIIGDRVITVDDRTQRIMDVMSILMRR